MENKQPKKPIASEDQPKDAQNRGNKQEKKAKVQEQVRSTDKKTRIAPAKAK